MSDDGGKTWRITLRPDLMFHDDTKVLAPDCAASIRRWGARDGFGQALLAASDQRTAFQSNLTGVLPGNPVFWNIRRT